MQFTSHRKLVLAAAGHVLPFEKGDTKFVPPILRPKALEEGLEPVLEEGQAAPATPVTPADTARVEAVKAALRVIRDRNRRTDFDGGGAPTVKAIQAESEGSAAPNDKAERLALWAEVRAEV